MKFLIALLALYSVSAFSLTTGEKAPDFTLKGINPNMKDVSLSAFKGKTVVLEWTNHGCPFVKKHYDSGNMQALQKKYTDKGVVWISIISSAPGKQGHVDLAQAKTDKDYYKSSASDVLLDPQGTVGKLYEAKTTPHMYIVDKNGTLVYQGAIDDHPDFDKSSIAQSKNYVAGALDEVMSGKKVTHPTTKSYGCSVKY